MRILEKAFSKKWITFLRYAAVVTIVCLIMISPLQMAGSASSPIDIQSLIPQPAQKNGQDVMHAIARGLEENNLPKIPDQTADPVYNQWKTMDQIYYGLAYLQNVTALNPEMTSLWSIYIGTNTTQKFVQTVFGQRSNSTDLWWAAT